MRDGSGTRRAALAIHTVADVAAAFLGLWIALYLPEADHALLDHGLPAVIHLAVGHGVAVRLRRF
ncbi:hypothetical protein [Streptomyces collinus]|uniref:hypothetical protein n=1 Tax=Streptomyces collinus TaxID=42684 RepID=UPI00363096A9